MTEDELHPIDETQEAVDEYGPFTYEGRDLLLSLAAFSEEVQHRVPACVGMSLSLVDLGVTFTLAATDRRIAALDAMQYVDGGPCVDAVHRSSIGFTTDAEASGVDAYELFSRASAENGISSTLSLPLVRGGVGVGGFNLYASTADAFDGQHDDLALVLGAWAEGAVSDADLRFGTRDVAARAPGILRGATRMIIACALLAQTRELSPDEAEHRLHDAAVRAGAPLDVVVDTVIAVLGAPPPPGE